MVYQLSASGFELEVTLARINDLLIHEEIIPELLEELIELIESDGELRHPVIVDKETLTVLDGMHRVAALKELGCELMPVCLVNYQDPKVEVGTWNRYWKDLTLNVLLETCREVGFKPNSCTEKNLDGPIDQAAVMSGRTTNFLDAGNEGLMGIYGMVESVEQELSSQDSSVSYEVKEEAIKKIKNQGGVVLFLPLATKKDIVRVAKSNQVFPHKTTRHVIPARPMSVNVPLDQLENENLAESDSRLTQSLEEREIKKLPSGSSFEDRVYEEELCVFK